MVNELSNLRYDCSEADLAPNGPGYDNMASQVCSVKGSVSGDPFVSGAAFALEQYGFYSSNLWRNVIINAALVIFFALCTG